MRNNKTIIQNACGLLASYQWLPADGNVYKYVSCAFKMWSPFFFFFYYIIAPFSCSKEREREKIFSMTYGMILV